MCMYTCAQVCLPPLLSALDLLLLGEPLPPRVYSPVAHVSVDSTPCVTMVTYHHPTLALNPQVEALKPLAPKNPETRKHKTS